MTGARKHAAAARAKIELARAKPEGTFPYPRYKLLQVQLTEDEAGALLALDEQVESLIVDRRTLRLETLRDLRTYAEAGILLDIDALDELMSEVENATEPV